MPHITKWQERRQCIRLKEQVWDKECARPVAGQAVRALAIPEKFYSVLKELPTKYSDYTVDNKRTLFDLIEDIVSDTIVSNWTNENFFNEFVDIKEVPYGRYNSDSDYRGS